MRAQLRDSGWVVNEYMITNIETLDLYDSLVANKSIDRFAGSANTVLFPLYPPSQTDEVFDVVTEIRLCHVPVLLLIYVWITAQSLML